MSYNLCVCPSIHIQNPICDTFCIKKRKSDQINLCLQTTITRFVFILHPSCLNESSHHPPSVYEWSCYNSQLCWHSCSSAHFVRQNKPIWARRNPGIYIYMFVSLYKLIRIGTKSLKIYSRFVHCLVLGLTSHERQHLVPQTLGLQKKIKSVRDQRWWGDCMILKKHKHKRNNNSLFSHTSPCTVEKNVTIYFVDIYFTDSAQIQSVGHNRDLNTSERTALKDLQSVAPGPLRCIWLGE